LTRSERDKRIRKDLKKIRKLEEELRVQKVDNYKKAYWSFTDQRVGASKGNKKYSGLYRQKWVAGEHVNVYVASSWQDLGYKIHNEAQAKGWSTGWAREGLTKKEYEILNYIEEHVRKHPFKARLPHIDKYRNRLGLKFRKKFGVYTINGKVSVPERKKILQTARKEFSLWHTVYDKLQNMARIQGEGNDSEDNFIRFAHLVIEESLAHTVTGIRNFLTKCVKVGVYSMLKLSEVNIAAKEIIIINQDVAEYLRRQIRKTMLDKSWLEPDWPTYKELDNRESTLRSMYCPYSITAMRERQKQKDRQRQKIARAKRRNLTSNQVRLYHKSRI
jgi:hypothetical protein